MYERVYYPLASDDDNLRVGMVVDIDRTTGTPTVTLRSPLQVLCVCNNCFCVVPSTLDSPIKWIISRVAKLPLSICSEHLNEI